MIATYNGFDLIVDHRINIMGASVGGCVLDVGELTPHCTDYYNHYLYGMTITMAGGRRVRGDLWSTTTITIMQGV